MRLLRVMSYLAAIAVFALAASARATVVVVPSLEEMAVAADVVGEVVVGDARTVREGGRVVTYTTLAVKDGWKGLKTGDVVQVWQLGGSLDGKGAWIVGAHQFVKGERMVFFGMRHAKAGADVVIPYGIGFGLFAVQEELTGEKVVEIVGDVVALDPATKQTGHVQARRYDSLAAFKQTALRLVDMKDLPKLTTKQKLEPRKLEKGQ